MSPQRLLNPLHDILNVSMRFHVFFFRCVPVITLQVQSCGVKVGVGVGSRSESALLAGIGVGVDKILPTPTPGGVCWCVDGLRIWQVGFLTKDRIVVFSQCRTSGENKLLCNTTPNQFNTEIGTRCFDLK